MWMTAILPRGRSVHPPTDKETAPTPIIIIITIHVGIGI